MLDLVDAAVLVVLLVFTSPIWLAFVAFVFISVGVTIADWCKWLCSPSQSNQQHQDLAQFQSQRQQEVRVEPRQEQAPPPELQVRSDFVKTFLHSRTLQEGESTRVIAAVIAGTNDETQDEQGGIVASIRSRAESTAKSIVESIRSTIGPKQECCFCLGSYKAGDTVVWAKNEDCNHMFHENCIIQWLDKHNDCPLCRTNLLEGDYSEE